VQSTSLFSGFLQSPCYPGRLELGLFFFGLRSFSVEAKADGIFYRSYIILTYDGERLTDSILPASTDLWLNASSSFYSSQDLSLIIIEVVPGPGLFGPVPSASFLKAESFLGYVFVFPSCMCLECITVENDDGVDSLLWGRRVNFSFPMFGELVI
jgi:hypothetical protein